MDIQSDNKEIINEDIKPEINEIEIENNINAIHILKSNCFFEITIKDIIFNLDAHITAKLPSIFNINEENVIVKAPNSITMFPLLEFITSKKDFSKMIINEVLYPKMNQILTTEFNLTLPITLSTLAYSTLSILPQRGRIA